MSPRWNWDFEDGERATRRSPIVATAWRAAGAGGRTRPPGSARIRRRRLGAALAFAVLVIVLVVALSSSHHSGVGLVGGRERARVARRFAARGRAGRRGGTRRKGGRLGARLHAVRARRRREGPRRRADLRRRPRPVHAGRADVLEREHVPGDVLRVGQEIPDFRASAEREIRGGFVIGDHTENHPMLAHLSAHDQHEQLFEQAARIELLGGRRPRLFRPPYGSFNATTFRVLRADAHADGAVVGRHRRLRAPGRGSDRAARARRRQARARSS